ncbi:MAG TPA: hypothetical protein VEI54_01065 [Candidatus Limnocylindrales bacterium]|nr:hypothetical protein [Candidatus Limnocylindrales bacterium]
MNVLNHRNWPFGLVLLAVAALCATGVCADEIRLKDGRKLHGVIVGYEDNMFKVKTDFGYELVEKNKIASIIPDTPAEPASAKKEPEPKPGSEAEAKATPATEPAAPKKEKPAISVNANARPEIPVPAKATSDANAPALKTATAAPKTALLTTTPPPPPPKEEPPPKREEIQGNLYINHEFGFRMYKAPSWQIIDGAGQTLPNAIVAMGTPNESTLLVVGHEKNKAALEAAAQSVEKRLHDVYENYRLLSQRKTVVGGRPGIEYRYRGLAEDHDWSGTLSVVAQGDDVLTVLGMTFADSDLIQIQENVIARSIASLEFGKF